MLVTKKTFIGMLSYTADLWLTNTDQLNEIDSRFGDGDHGITIGKIAHAMKDAVKNEDGKSIREIIESLSYSIMGISGGSAGSLYGTLIGGLGEPLGNEEEIDGALLKVMFQSSYDEMKGITKATVGDKTMMDALIPAVEAAFACEGDIADILCVATKAAKDGATYSENVVSKFGRARSYGDKTIGTPDAGAISTSLFFQGLHDGYLDQQENIK